MERKRDKKLERARIENNLDRQKQFVSNATKRTREKIVVEVVVVNFRSKRGQSSNDKEDMSRRRRRYVITSNKVAIWPTLIDSNEADFGGVHTKNVPFRTALALNDDAAAAVVALDNNNNNTHNNRPTRSHSHSLH